MKSTQKSTLKTQKQFETDVSTDAGKSLTLKKKEVDEVTVPASFKALVRN